MTMGNNGSCIWGARQHITHHDLKGDVPDVPSLWVDVPIGSAVGIPRLHHKAVRPLDLHAAARPRYPRKAAFPGAPVCAFVLDFFDLTHLKQQIQGLVRIRSWAVVP